MKALSVSLLCLLYLWQVFGVAAKAAVDPTEFVNVFIGTRGDGQTYPGATVPFGMVQLSPDTDCGGANQPPFSGYSYDHESLMGFSHNHLSGTGAGDLGDILLVPTEGKIEIIPGTLQNPQSGYRQHFNHKNESALPGYYSVKLDGSNIRTELTATTHVGWHRYTFPDSVQSNIIIDLGHGIGLSRPLDTSIDIVNDHTVTGKCKVAGWAARSVFFVAEFSQPFHSFGTSPDGIQQDSSRRHAEGKKVKAWLQFRTSSASPIIVKVALSTTSIDGARANLTCEAGDWNFDAARQHAHDEWQKALSVIEIDGPPEKKKIFYSALYHVLQAPNVISDVDGRFRGADEQVHTATGHVVYSTFSLWDTFRAEHPLLTIIQPARVNDFISSFQDQATYDKDQILPIWSLYGMETYTMIGYHSWPVIAEAYLKGIRKWDSNKLFDSMLANSHNQDSWKEQGYIPSDRVTESVSKTLEFSYDFYALSKFARALGNPKVADEFQNRAQSYRNVFDESCGFARGKMDDGSWRTPFDPERHTMLNRDKVCDFTEANSWIYSFFVPHDIRGITNLMGGQERFANKLDELFVWGKDRTNSLKDGRIGKCQLDNEPSHHLPYLYCFAGQPWKCQEIVEDFCNKAYSNSPEGLCGNDDCGQMSAWYVFSCLGFYPVDPVQCSYILGAPMFSHSSIKLPNGKIFTINAMNLTAGNRYVEKVLLNGKILQRIYINHSELLDGGNLEFVMSAKPGSSWGTQASSLPP